jgi:hypothetical protein
MKISEPTAVQPSSLSRSTGVAKPYARASLSALGAVERVHQVAPTASSVASNRKEHIASLLLEVVEQMRPLLAARQKNRVNISLPHGLGVPVNSSAAAKTEQGGNSQKPDELNTEDTHAPNVNTPKKPTARLQRELANLAVTADGRSHFFRLLITTPNWLTASVSDRQAMVSMLERELRPADVMQSAEKAFPVNSSKPLFDTAIALNTLVSELFVLLQSRATLFPLNFATTTGSTILAPYNADINADDSSNFVAEAPESQPNIRPQRTTLPVATLEAKLTTLRYAEAMFASGALLQQTAIWPMLTDAQKKLLVEQLSSRLFSDENRAQSFAQVIQSKLGLLDRTSAPLDTSATNSGEASKPEKTSVQDVTPREMTGEANVTRTLERIGITYSGQSNDADGHSNPVGGTFGNASVSPMNDVDIPTDATEFAHRVTKRERAALACQMCGSLFESNRPGSDDADNPASLHRGAYRMFCSRCANGRVNSSLMSQR